MLCRLSEIDGGFLDMVRNCLKTRIASDVPTSVHACTQAVSCSLAASTQTTSETSDIGNGLSEVVNSVLRSQSSFHTFPGIICYGGLVESGYHIR